MMKVMACWRNMYSLRCAEFPSSGHLQHLNLATLRVSLLWGAQRKSRRTPSRNMSSTRSLKRAIKILSTCHYIIKIILIHGFRKLIISFKWNLHYYYHWFFIYWLVTAFSWLSFFAQLLHCLLCLDSRIASCARTLAGFCITALFWLVFKNPVRSGYLA